MLSLRNQTVSVYDYGRWQEIPLTSVVSEMDPLDPRIDPYIKELAGYYQAWKEWDAGEDGGDGASPWQILYVESRESLNQFEQRISPLFSAAGIGYALPELSGTDPRLLWILSGLFFASLAAALGRRWWQILFLLLPWVAAVKSGRPEVLLSNNLLALSLVFIQQEILPLWRSHLDYPLSRYEALSRFMVPALPGFFLFGASWILLGLAGAGEALPGLLAGLTAHLCWMGAELAFVQWWRFRRIHRLYQPLFFTAESRLRRLPAKRGILVGLMLLALPLAALSGDGGSSWRLPVPECRGGEISWKSLAVLWETKNAGDLPNLADFLTHRAYQEGFFYGGSYDFPQPDGALKKTEFISSDTGVLEREVSLLEFTNSWYVDILGGAKKIGIPSLLLNQETPVSVGIKPLMVPKPALSWFWAGVILVLMCGFYPSLVSIFLQKRAAGPWGRSVAEKGAGAVGEGKLRRYQERTGVA